MPSPVPHRSLRARLTHPAPHTVASLHDSSPSRTLASLPSGVSLRRSQGSMSPASVFPKVPTIRRPLPSTGSLRVGSPASSVILSAPTPCHPSPQASSPSPSDTASAPTSLLPSPGECIPRGASGRDHRLSHSGCHLAEMTGPPRFLGDPNACMPCSSTPAEP